MFSWALSIHLSMVVLSQWWWWSIWIMGLPWFCILFFDSKSTIFAGFFACYFLQSRWS